MNCPHCKATIDDDSLFCDQCGGEILVCPTCGRQGKGKRCIFDGTALVKPTGGAAPAASAPKPAASAPGAASQGARSPAPAAPSPAALGQAAPQASVPSSGASAGTLHLYNMTYGIDIRPADGDVIGRQNGPFVSQFGGFSHLSRTHARIVRKGAEWFVEDEGSLNGTQVDGVKLAPHVPASLSDGGTLRLSTLDLCIEIDAPADSEKTVTG